ncbi:MAG TPA: GGDEF domain-containing protein [Methylophilaceae bacterium]|nr:GGDEF domain-containing protein [Methylophilaceae bacterium]
MRFLGIYSAHWMIFLGPLFIIIGAGLFINGLQAFSNRAPDRRIPLLLALVMGSVNWVLVHVYHDLQAMKIFNSILFALVYFAAGCMMVRPANMNLRVIYLVNACLLYLMALFMVYRASAAYMAAPEMFTDGAEWIVDQLTLLAFFIQQLATTLSLTLMLHYRNVQLLRDQIAFDELTCALNQRGLHNAAKRVVAACQHNDEILSLMLINIDKLQSINAAQGHDMGNQILRELSQLIHSVARPADVIGRIHGDRFCMLLPNTPERLAIELAEKIRNEIELTIVFSGDQNTFVTVSIGVSNSEYVGLDFGDLLSAAESAMYNAQESGNKIVAHSDIHKLTKGAEPLQGAMELSGA